MTQSILLLNPTRVEATEGRRRAEQVRAVEARPSSAPHPEAEITVRALHERDLPAIKRLAGRDSTAVPTDRMIGAEIDGVLVAVLSLANGSVIADPFRPTSSAIELMRLRARQLGSGGRRRLPRLRRQPRARGALAGSPPGGSRLLQL